METNSKQMGKKDNNGKRQEMSGHYEQTNDHVCKSTDYGFSSSPPPPPTFPTEQLGLFLL